jgi:hypothetical protein
MQSTAAAAAAAAGEYTRATVRIQTKPCDIQLADRPGARRRGCASWRAKNMYKQVQTELTFNIHTAREL